MIFFMDKLKKEKWQALLYDNYQKYIMPLKARLVVPRLRVVHIEPTNTCNLNCTVCFSQHPKKHVSRKRGFMPIDLYKRIIDELSSYCHTLNLGLNFGGESFMHKNFNEMINYAAAKKRFSIGFTTNGSYLTEKTVRDLLQSNIDNIIISLDGLMNNHNTLRSGSDFNNVRNNILKFIELRGMNKKPIIDVNLTQSIQSEADIRSFTQEWVKIVDSVKIYPCLTEDLKIMDINYFKDLSVRKSYMCMWPFDYLAILWNGDVTTCCGDINGVNVVGNVTEHGVFNLWNSKAYKKLRYDSATNHFSPEIICSSCNYWQLKFVPSSKVIDNTMVNYSAYCKTYTKLNV